MERIPIIEERVRSLEKRIDVLHEENKNALREFKEDMHDMRVTMNKICISVEVIKNTFENKRYLVTTLAGLAGASLGAAATLWVRTWH